MPKLVIDPKGSVNEAVDDGIKIEKNIPMPAQKRGPPSKYRWADMEVGDSFLFPSTLSLASCRTLAWGASKRLGRKFSVMKTSDGNRCWRIEDGE